MSSQQTEILDSHERVDVIAMLEVLWRYKILLCGLSALGAAIALYLASTTPYIYEASVVVTPVSENENGGTGSLASRLGGLAGLAGINLQNAGGNLMEAQATLQSRHLAQSFIERYKLTPVLLGKSPRQSVWLAVDKFSATTLKIKQDKEKGTTTVSIRWKDPQLVARWANDYIALANETLRNRALAEAGRNIKYLNEQISKTSIIEIQRVLYGLVENQTKNQMLASTRSEYAFTVIDPAVVPEERVWPRRSIMLLTGIAAGFMLGVFVSLTHNLWRRRAGLVCA